MNAKCLSSHANACLVWAVPRVTIWWLKMAVTRLSRASALYDGVVSPIVSKSLSRSLALKWKMEKRPS